jgi:membrane protease YdiL (CAAX protease family)
MAIGSQALAATDSTHFPLAVSSQRRFSRDLTETIVAFVLILAVLWLPTREQLIAGPIALLAPLALTLWRRPSREELGTDLRGLLRSLWIVPATVVVTIASVFLARRIGTYHPLYQPGLGHVGGYVLWTVYQQFLLQDYFMPRLTRLWNANVAVAVTALLFAACHLPNLPLVLATLVWGATSCALFRKYRSLWVLGVAQGLLGLCFAICVPDAMHHHMRVGLGYLRYRHVVHGS